MGIASFRYHGDEFVCASLLYTNIGIKSVKLHYEPKTKESVIAEDSSDLRTYCW
jgi:hypothetical protein